MSDHGHKPIRILLANNQELLRCGLRMLFQSEPDFELVGIARDFEETVALSQQYLPDIVLFDYMIQESNCVVQDNKCLLQSGNGIEKIPEILSASPSANAVTAFSPAEVVKLVDTLASGASWGNSVEVQVLSSAPVISVI